MPLILQIDSDEEDEPKPQCSPSPPTSDVEPAEHLLCQFAYPENQGGKWQHTKLGIVSVRLLQSGTAACFAGGGGGSVAMEAELEMTRMDGRSAGGIARVPIVSIIRLDMAQGGDMVVVGLSSVMDASGLRPGSRETFSLHEFAFVFLESEVPTSLATLRWWLPHIGEQQCSAPGQQPSSVEVTALSFDGITLKAHDIGLLGDERCLNDTCVDFFLRLAMEFMAPPDLRATMYVLSALFLQKLTSRGAKTGEDGWHNLSRRDIREGGVLRRQHVILPINVQNKHWWLAVICNPVSAFASNPPKLRKALPRIVCLDSSRESVPHSSTVGFLRGYLWREWCARENQDVLSDSAVARKAALPTSLKVVVADTPKQTNCYDCGIFIIEYLLHLFTSPSALTALGLAPHSHWFNQGIVSHRRRRLRWVAAMLQTEAKRRGTADVGHLLQDEQLKRTLSPAFIDRPPAKKQKVDSS